MALERRKCSLSPLGGGEGPGWAAGAQGDPKPPQRAVSGSGRGCSPGWVILEPPGCPRSSSLPALPEECALSWGWPVRRKESYVWSADEVILSGNHWKHSPLQPSSFSQETTLGGEAKTASYLTFLDFFFPPRVFRAPFLCVSFPLGLHISYPWRSARSSLSQRNCHNLDQEVTTFPAFFPST